MADVHAEVGLEGGHQQMTCADCHPGAGTAALTDSTAFVGLGAECEDCHLDEHAEVKDPDHETLGFSTRCVQCHTSESWRPASSHHDTSHFRLVGGHAGLRCSTCHEDNLYAALPEDCWSCHQADHADAEPDHEALGLGQACTDCHTVDAWSPSTFDHDATDFALRGAHAGTDCVACHTETVDAPLAMDCWSCHRTDYEDAEPDHGALELAQDCTACHGEQAWSPSSFDHDQTDYPLRAGHRRVACQDCHTEPVSTPLATDCWSCHQSDAENAEPDHTDFDRDCTACHTLEAWSPATFDHDQTDFPLIGAHVEVTCMDCHAEGYVETPGECFDCHADDEPESHFGPACGECHTTTAWEPATFDHEPLFPLQRGEHRRYRNSCGSCHLDAATTYATFTCTDCHDGEHDRGRTDGEHDEVRDYRYDSVACFDCHPTGSEDDAEDD